MFRSIRWKITLPFVLLILAVMGGLWLYLSGFIRHTYLENLENQLLAEARILASDLAPRLETASAADDLDSQARQWANILSARVTIISPEGIVLGESHEERAQMDNHSNRPEVAGAFARSQATSTRYSETIGTEMMYTAVAVIHNKLILGVVRVALPLTEVNANMANLQRVLSTATLLAAALAALLAFLIAARITRPVRELTAYASSLADGRLEGPLPSAGDEVEQLARVFERLSSQLRAKIADLESERGTLEAVLQKMNDGVLLVDEQGIIRLANPAAERMFATGQRPLPGRSLVEGIWHPRAVELWKQSLESGSEQGGSLETRQRVSLQALALPLAPALPGSTLLLFQDQTRQRQVERLRRDFISNVSHELRTPVAAIKALAETLRDGALEDPPAARRFIERMEVEADALSQMVNELLELSRIESGRVPLERQPSVPCEVILPAAERMRLQAERAGLRLEVDCSSGLPRMLADGPRVQGVLTNLIDNAIKFTRNGSVTVQAALEGNAIRFAVKDTGIGIPREEQERIFERFYKVDRARSAGGTGLGLAIARHVVEGHGGAIWLESEPGQGTAVFFTIPLA